MNRSIKFILLLFLLHSFLLFGKETKKITIVHTYPEYKEIFYVLKSDTSVREGSYRAEAMRKVLVEGYYRMGYKDSIWTQYNMSGQIRSKGLYEKDRRVGPWEFFSDTGELEQKIDFPKDEVLFYQTSLAQQTFRITSGKDTLLSVLDRPPLYLGGSGRFNDYVANEIIPPLHKSTEKTEGTIYIGLTIDSTGRSSNQHVLRGISNAYNTEALRVLKSIPDEWIPGVLNGKKVSVDYVIQFIFEENALEIKP